MIKIKCSNCGLENKETASFCKECGTPLNHNSNIQTQSKQISNNDSGTKKIIIICITVIICVALIGGGILYVVSNNNSNNSNLNYTENKTNETIDTETTTAQPSNINEIYWVEFFLDGNPNTGADATIYVGPEYSGEQVEVSMSYSRNGNYFESEGYNWYTVASDGTIFVRTTSALNKYPDKCEITLSHNGNTITATCPMKKHKGTQKSYPN